MERLCDGFQGCVGHLHSCKLTQIPNKRRMSRDTLGSLAMLMRIRTDTEQPLGCCGLKCHWVLTNMPSILCSLASNSSLHFWIFFQCTLEGQLVLKYVGFTVSWKKSANCIIVGIFNTALHNDLPSQIIHLPTKTPNSGTSYITLRDHWQRYYRQAPALQKAVTFNACETCVPHNTKGSLS